MLTLLNIFGRSPFASLKAHMEKVASCVHKLPDLFHALQLGDMAAIRCVADQISSLEHDADLVKNDIRNHLPKRMFLAIDRSQLLEILTLQDSLADRAEDIAVLASLHSLPFEADLQDLVWLFLQKNLETFNAVLFIIKEMHELLETTFGGLEAEKIRDMVEKVGVLEHEADLIQRQLLQALLQNTDQRSYATFYLWNKIFESLGSLSNLSEKLANRVRMTLEIQ